MEGECEGESEGVNVSVNVSVKVRGSGCKGMNVREWECAGKNNATSSLTIYVTFIPIMDSFVPRSYPKNWNEAK